jgi:hypothetical protein
MSTIKPDLTATQRLHAHIRKRLAGQPDWRIAMAIAIADAIHLDGIGHMQTALDAALSVTSKPAPQPPQATA